MARGLDPTRIGRPARRVPVLTGVTVPEPRLTTYAVRPSGVRATASGSCPTGIGRPLRSVVRSTGVTVPEPEFATNAVGCLGGPAPREGGGLGPDGGWAANPVAGESLRCGEEAAGRAGAGPEPKTSLTGRAKRSLAVSAGRPSAASIVRSRL